MKKDGTRPGKRLEFANLNMAIEIVDLPTKNGDFPYSYVSLPEGNTSTSWKNITFRNQKRPAKRCRTRHTRPIWSDPFFIHLDFHRNITRILSEMDPCMIYIYIYAYIC